MVKGVPVERINCGVPVTTTALLKVTMIGTIPEWKVPLRIGEETLLTTIPEFIICGGGVVGAGAGSVQTLFTRVCGDTQVGTTGVGGVTGAGSVQTLFTKVCGDTQVGTSGGGVESVDEGITSTTGGVISSALAILGILAE